MNNFGYNLHTSTFPTIPSCPTHGSKHTVSSNDGNTTQRCTMCNWMHIRTHTHYNHNNLETIFIKQFEEIFKLPFNNVVNIEDIGAYTDDDGIYHFINIAFKNVYSFDTFNNMWLEKNLYKNDILQRLNIPF